MQVEMRPSWKSLISPLNTATTHENEIGHRRDAVAVKPAGQYEPAQNS